MNAARNAVLSDTGRAHAGIPIGYVARNIGDLRSVVMLLEQGA
jgi:hypothetical protein